MRDHNNTTLKLGLITGIVLAFSLVAAPTEAELITWGTCKAGGGGTCAHGLTPSARTPTSTGGVTSYTFDAIGGSAQLVTRAFHVTDLDTGTTGTTTSSIFTGGLGAGGEGSPEHSVDNEGPDELIVFQFPEDGYLPVSFSIGWFKDDADIETYIGGTLGGADDAITLLTTPGFVWDAGLLGADYIHEEFLDVDSPSSGDYWDPNPFTKGASGAYLIIATRTEGTSSDDGGEDKFKISQIVADPVPEPGILLLLGLGLAGLSFGLRRQS